MINEQGERDPITGQYPGSEIETKEFFRTSEFWAMTVLALSLVVATLSLNSLDAPRTSMLLTILVSAYIVGRGISKAGSSHPFWGRELNLRDRFGSDRGEESDDRIRRLEARLEQMERSSHATSRVQL